MAPPDGSLPIALINRPPLFRGKPAKLRVEITNRSASIVPQTGTLSVFWRGAPGAEVKLARDTFSLTADIAPGSRHEQILKVVVPRLTGHAELGLSLCADQAPGDGGAQGSLLVPVQIVHVHSVLTGAIECIEGMQVITPGTTFAGLVRIHNRSATAWNSAPPFPVVLAWSWRRLDDSTVLGARGKMSLTGEILPNQHLDMLVEINGPKAAGDWVLELTLHQVEVVMFERSKAFSPLRTQVRVVEPGDSAERRLTATERERFVTLAYRRWLDLHDRFGQPEQSAAAATIASWPRLPLISLLMRIDDAPESVLREAVESVRAQAYTNWELCLVDNGPERPALPQLLCQWAAEDSRIRVSREGSGRSASAAANILLGMARGEFSLLLQAEDVLAPHALLFVAGEALRDDVDWVYGDEDRRDGKGERCSPFFWPAPDRTLCLSLPYMTAHAAFRTSLIREAGGFREAHQAACQHDVGLRILERIELSRIRHIPHLTCSRRLEPGAAPLTPTPPAHAALARTIGEHLQALGTAAAVEPLHGSAGYRVRFPLPDPAPLVSIIVPTRDRLDLLRPCLASVIDRTSYSRYEIIVVDNGSQEAETHRYLQELSTAGVKVIRVDEPFNWSRLSNLGVAASAGSVLCLLNNDTQIISESWLDELVSHATRPDVGVVGPALWYPDGRLQHGGIRVTAGGLPREIRVNAQRFEGNHWSLGVARSVDAVTGACLVVRRETYWAAGGMDERYLPVGYNDVDFCFRVQERLGLSIVWTPFAELMHRVSESRGPPQKFATSKTKRRTDGFMTSHWLERMWQDDRYNPNLSATRDHEIELKPRVSLRGSILSHHAQWTRKLVFVHIPKTAGIALRSALTKTLPGRVMIVSGRINMQCYDGDERILELTKKRARDASTIFSHVRHGFGRVIGAEATYATVLRDPVKRVISQARHLLEGPMSPLRDSELGNLSIIDLIKFGIVPSNLMTRMIAGGRPETATWCEIFTGGRAHAAGFVGFSLPREVWTSTEDAILARGHEEPLDDQALLDRALAVIESDFAFVGLQERLDEHAAELARALGWQELDLREMNASKSGPVKEDPELRAAVEAYNALDRALYDFVASRPRGMILREHRLVDSACRLAHGG